MIRQIIDFHVHVFTRDQFYPDILQFMEEQNPEGFSQELEVISSPTALVASLREEGVRYAVILAEHAPAATGQVPSEYVAEFCRDQEALIPFASLNPNSDKDPVEKLHYYIEGLGMRGLKLLPSYGLYYPNESSVYPIYAEAQRLKLPILFHTGTSTFKGTRLKYSDPLYLDDVAVDFPSLTIVMAHSGRGLYYDRAFFLARRHPNVYMEISGLPPKRLLDYFPDFERNADKIVFGSDWPGIPSQGIRANVEAFCSLPLKSSTIDKVLYENAARILFSG